MFAWALPLVFFSSAESTALQGVPRSDFEVAPYQPWRSSDDLPDATLPSDGDAPLSPREASQARRPLELRLGAAALPLECATRRPCGSSSWFGGLAWRGFPHFAWSFGGEWTRTATEQIGYFSIGGRVYALDEGAFDPYLELNLGAEYWAPALELGLGGELVFGASLYLLEQLRLGLLVKLRYGLNDADLCRAGAYRCCRGSCDRWSSVGERWLGLGVALEVPLGPPH
jgi:hypothetical protein